MKSRVKMRKAVQPVWGSAGGLVSSAACSLMNVVGKNPAHPPQGRVGHSVGELGAWCANPCAHLWGQGACPRSPVMGTVSFPSPGQEPQIRAGFPCESPAPQAFTLKLEKPEDARKQSQVLQSLRLDALPRGDGGASD